MRGWLTAAALGVVGSACLLDFSGLTGGVPDGSCASGCDGGAACAGTAGPAAIRISTGSGSFCIDTTEVTNAQYQAFLNVKGSDTSGQASYCNWNTSYQPDVWPPGAQDGELPVLGADWCDAVAFCAWAGKALCGKQGGGHLPLSAANDASLSAWYFACSRGGTLTYPYGDAFDAGACVDDGAVQAVATAPGCQGGYAGLHDMSGNASEWIDSCEAYVSGSTAATDGCLALGGDFQTGSASALECAMTSMVLELQYRSATDFMPGFRCCSD